VGWNPSLTAALLTAARLAAARLTAARPAAARLAAARPAAALLAAARPPPRVRRRTSRRRASRRHASRRAFNSSTEPCSHRFTFSFWPNKIQQLISGRIVETCPYIYIADYLDNSHGYISRPSHEMRHIRYIINPLMRVYTIYLPCRIRKRTNPISLKNQPLSFSQLVTVIKKYHSLWTLVSVWFPLLRWRLLNSLSCQTLKEMTFCRTYYISIDNVVSPYITFGRHEITHCFNTGQRHIKVTML